MRLLHTSDLHIGLTLEGLPMLEHQRSTLSFIASVVEREEVDVVLIAGDVYDRSLPSVEAVVAFEEALVALARHCTVVVSSGNHDSAVRLGFGSRLFSEKLHLRTSPERIDDPVLIEDEHGTVAVYGIPYLDPDLTRHKVAPQPVERSHQAVLAAACDRVRADLEQRTRAGVPPRSVVLAHAFIVGAAGSAERSDSERDIRVGNVDCASASVFEGFDYVALGHLHGPQEPQSPGPGVVRYSGSPLRYSFSEAAHAKSVTLVDLDADGVKSVSVVEVPQPRPMAVLTGTLDELLDPDRFAEHEGSWVKALVTDVLRPERMHPRLQERFAHLVVSFHEPPRRETRARFEVAGRRSDPMDVLIAFLSEAQGGTAATDEQITAVRASLEAVRAQEVSA